MNELFVEVDFWDYWYGKVGVVFDVVIIGGVGVIGCFVGWGCIFGFGGFFFSICISCGDIIDDVWVYVICGK